MLSPELTKAPVASPPPACVLPARIEFRSPTDPDPRYNPPPLPAELLATVTLSSAAAFARFAPPPWVVAMLRLRVTLTSWRLDAPSFDWTPPPFELAVFVSNSEFVMNAVPTFSKPAPSAAEFSVKRVESRSNVPSLAIPPPAPLDALFPETIASVRFKVVPLRTNTPPPSTLAFPSIIEKPVASTTAELRISNTRSFELPVTVVTPAPAPAMTRSPRISRSPLAARSSLAPVNVMPYVPLESRIPSVPTVLFVAMMASRSEMNVSVPRVASRFAMDDVFPSTTSLVVSTTKVAAVVRVALNSDVSPVAKLVAVAVIVAASATTALNEPTNLVFPLASVMTLRKPRYVSPSSAASEFAKNSSRNVVSARLLNVPDTATVEDASVNAAVSTGKFCNAFDPVSTSPTSFAVTPFGARSIPIPVLA